ncbi:MAG: hypothetical protein ACUVR1_08695 [Fimbriimonadales bacterium]
MKVSHVIIAISVAFLLVCVLCGIGLYYTVRGGIAGYRETTQVGDEFIRHLQSGRFQEASQMVDPALRGRYRAEDIRSRWDTLVNAIGTPQSWQLEDFNIQMDTAGQTASLRMSIRGSKAQGRVDLKMRQVGQQWWITEISFAW